ncbi:MAG TPA: FG-GAP-like repeat-containing protein, partial [Tepidisphaeraceae bacterium]
ATTPVVVSGSGAVYTVTVNGITGGGSLGLNLVDNGTIQDAGRTMTYATQQNPLGTGSHPRSVALTDINGDGKPDLVVANFSGNSLAVMLGNGNGTFTSQQTYAVGAIHTYGMSLVVMDVNGDGKKDAVIASTGATGVVSVLLGNGNGTFAPQNTFSAGPNTYAVAVADVNGDSKMDLAVADNSSQNGSVGILLGNGNRTFQALQTVSSGTYPQSIAAGDVTGDGKPDLVAGLYGTNQLSLMVGNGNGTFKAPVTFGGGTGPTSVTIADVSGDGKQDLVVSDFGSGNIGVLIGNGNGTFLGIRSTFAGTGAFSVAVADVNADGKLDLAVATDNPAGTVSVLLGNGSGVYQAAQTFALGANPVSVAIGDMNGDGKPDIVAANLNGNSVSFLIENQNINFAGQTYTVLPLLNTIGGTAGADQITLTRDIDSTHIDWTAGSTSGQLLINNPAGLTINGNGGNDIITLINTNGNPLPNSIHLNGAFTVSGLSPSNPLAATTLDIGQSTVYLFYGGAASPISTIQQYLTNGYNGGTWNGTPTASTGVITSASAASGPANGFGVGFADSADGFIAGQPANTIELLYTAMGDANLDRVVNMNDALRLQANWNATGAPAWDRGNFNFDAIVDSTDAITLARNYGSTATGSVAPAIASQSIALAATNAASSITTPAKTSPSVSSPIPPEDPHAPRSSKNPRRNKKHN